MYEYSRMSLVVLLLHSLSRTVVFDFSVGPWAILYLVLGHPSTI